MIRLNAVVPVVWCLAILVTISTAYAQGQYVNSGYSLNEQSHADFACPTACESSGGWAGQWTNTQETGVEGTCLCNGGAGVGAGASTAADDQSQSSAGGGGGGAYVNSGYSLNEQSHADFACPTACESSGGWAGQWTNTQETGVEGTCLCNGAASAAAGSGGGTSTVANDQSQASAGSGAYVNSGYSLNEQSHADFACPTACESSGGWAGQWTNTQETGVEGTCLCNGAASAGAGSGGGTSTVANDQSQASAGSGAYVNSGYSLNEQSHADFACPTACESSGGWAGQWTNTQETGVEGTCLCKGAASAGASSGSFTADNNQSQSGGGEYVKSGYSLNEQSHADFACPTACESSGGWAGQWTNTQETGVEGTCLCKGTASAGTGGGTSTADNNQSQSSGGEYVKSGYSLNEQGHADFACPTACESSGGWAGQWTNTQETGVEGTCLCKGTASAGTGGGTSTADNNQSQSGGGEYVKSGYSLNEQSHADFACPTACESSGGWAGQWTNTQETGVEGTCLCKGTASAGTGGGTSTADNNQSQPSGGEYVKSGYSLNEQGHADFACPTACESSGGWAGQWTNTQETGVEGTCLCKGTASAGNGGGTSTADNNQSQPSGGEYVKSGYSLNEQGHADFACPTACESSGGWAGQWTNTQETGVEGTCLCKGSGSGTSTADNNQSQPSGGEYVKSGYSLNEQSHADYACPTACQSSGGWAGQWTNTQETGVEGTCLCKGGGTLAADETGGLKRSNLASDEPAVQARCIVDVKLVGMKTTHERPLAPDGYELAGTWGVHGGRIFADDGMTPGRGGARQNIPYQMMALFTKSVSRSNKEEAKNCWGGIMAYANKKPLGFQGNFNFINMTWDKSYYQGSRLVRDIGGWQTEKHGAVDSDNQQGHTGIVLARTYNTGKVLTALHLTASNQSGSASTRRGYDRVAHWHVARNLGRGAVDGSKGAFMMTLSAATGEMGKIGVRAKDDAGTCVYDLRLNATNKPGQSGQEIYKPSDGYHMIGRWWSKWRADLGATGVTPQAKRTKGRYITLYAKYGSAAKPHRKNCLSLVWLTVANGQRHPNEPPSGAAAVKDKKYKPKWLYRGHWDPEDGHKGRAGAYGSGTNRPIGNWVVGLYVAKRFVDIGTGQEVALHDKLDIVRDAALYASSLANFEEYDKESKKFIKVRQLRNSRYGDPTWSVAGFWDVAEAWGSEGGTRGGFMAGLLVQYNKPALSKPVISGYWTVVANEGRDAEISESVNIGWNSSTSESKTKDFSVSLTQSLSVGGGIWGAESTTTFGFSAGTSKTLTQALGIQKGKSSSVSCGQKGKGNTKSLYQWVWDVRKQDCKTKACATVIRVRDTWCVVDAPGGGEAYRPKCMPGCCKDAICSKCWDTTPFCKLRPLTPG